MVTKPIFQTSKITGGTKMVLELRMFLGKKIAGIGRYPTWGEGGKMHAMLQISLTVNTNLEKCYDLFGWIIFKDDKH